MRKCNTWRNSLYFLANYYRHLQLFNHVSQLRQRLKLIFPWVGHNDKLNHLAEEVPEVGGRLHICETTKTLWPYFLYTRRGPSPFCIPVNAHTAPSFRRQKRHDARFRTPCLHNVNFCMLLKRENWLTDWLTDWAIIMPVRSITLNSVRLCKRSSKTSPQNWLAQGVSVLSVYFLARTYYMYHMNI